MSARGLKLRRGVPPRGAGSRRWALVAALLIAVWGGWAAAAAEAAGPQVSLLYPVTGSLTSSPLENPPHHRFWGHFSVDASGGQNAPVYARFANINGALSLSAAGTFEPCKVPGTGGSGLIIDVAVNGQLVGRVYYAHLSAITQTSGSIANGAQIGVLYNRANHTDCWQGSHVHVEASSVTGTACFVSRGLRTPVGPGDFLGVIGGGYTTLPDRPCPPGVEWFNGSIVQWNGDTKPQKTSWLVGADRRRRWVPDARTYSCLRGRGIPDAGPLAASLLDQLPDANGIWAQCPFGDLTYDGRVNIFDLSALLSQYQRTGLQKGDVNYDGVVNIFDLSILLSNYGRTS